MVLADDTVRAVQAAKLSEIGWTPEAVRALVAGGPLEWNAEIAGSTPGHSRAETLRRIASA